MKEKKNQNVDSWLVVLAQGRAFTSSDAFLLMEAGEMQDITWLGKCGREGSHLLKTPPDPNAPQISWWGGCEGSSGGDKHGSLGNIVLF